MRRILLSILVLFCIYITGCCSIPRVTSYKQLNIFTKQESKSKGRFSSRAKIVSIKDFRENEVLNKDIKTLKEKVEKYISSHADLNESIKNGLRGLRVTEGANKEEVELLLGEPDGIVKKDKEVDAASQVWTYQINKRSVFTIIFLPVYFGHEQYYLYFKDNILTRIERHYLGQTFHADEADMGIHGHHK